MFAPRTQKAPTNDWIAKQFAFELNVALLGIISSTMEELPYPRAGSGDERV